MKTKYGGQNSTAQTFDDNLEDMFLLAPKRLTLTIDAEISQYENTFSMIYEDNPLSFWKNYEQRLPLLASIARKYLAIPASSSPSERAFSRFKFITPSTRNRLDSTRIQQLMYMQSVFQNTTMNLFLENEQL